jgi:hypothetical protein
MSGLDVSSIFRGKWPRKKMLHGGLPLHSADIRAAHHAHATAAPRLARDPLDGVIPVLAFIVVWRKRSFRPKLPTAILRDEDVASLGPSLARGLLLRAIIRRASEDDGRLGDRVISIEVGGELHAIAHRDGNRFGFDLGEGRGGEKDGREDEGGFHSR